MTLEDIPNTYFEINDFLIENHTEFNTPENRELIIKMLTKGLPYTEGIRCDERNNTHNENKVVARVSYSKRHCGDDIYFVDLIFGDLDVEFIPLK